MDPVKEIYGSSTEIRKGSCAFSCGQISLQCLSLISNFLGSCKEIVSVALSKDYWTS